MKSLIGLLNNEYNGNKITVNKTKSLPRKLFKKIIIFQIISCRRLKERYTKYTTAWNMMILIAATTIAMKISLVKQTYNTQKVKIY